MKDKLTEEEVKHVSKLARISISRKETLEKYQYQLKEILDEVDKIKEVETGDNELLITPVDHTAMLSKDESGELVLFQEIKKNAPRVKGCFIEVPVMINE